MSKIAAIQMTSSASVIENLASAADFIQRAAQQGAKVAVLPEMFPLFGLNPEDKLAVSEPFGKGLIQDSLAELALQHKIWIIGGTIPLQSSLPHKIAAACLVYDHTGKVVGRYDKMHLFDVTINANESYQESAHIEPGNEVVLIDSPVGKIGLAVCYDIRFPELFRKLFNQGAEIFAIPAAFTTTTGKAHWEVLARSRAIENFCYVVGACQTGLHQNGRQTYGHSLIVNPWGTVLTSLADTTGIITADIDLTELKKIRRNIPVDQHQKIDIP